MERSSSFARSFFQAGGGTSNDPYGYGNAADSHGAAAGMGNNDMFGGQTMGTPRAQRRRSSRRKSRGGFGMSFDANMLQNAAAAAAAAMAGIDDNEPSNLAGGFMPAGAMGSGGASGDGTMGGSDMNRRGKQQRQCSWYQEALLQGGAVEDLNAFLAEASNMNEPDSTDDEVLEQYRIMAHMEANKQVKNNIGFDLAKYEEKRQMQPDNSSHGDYVKKPKPIFPEPRKLTTSSGSVGGVGGMQAEEPPLPPPRVNRRFIDQRSLRIPELCPGIVVRSGSKEELQPGEALTRCLGCRVQLRMKLFTTLVRCPECNTVSPATTTRH